MGDGCGVYPPSCLTEKLALCLSPEWIQQQLSVENISQLLPLREPDWNEDHTPLFVVITDGLLLKKYKTDIKHMSSTFTWL